MSITQAETNYKWRLAYRNERLGRRTGNLAAHIHHVLYGGKHVIVEVT